MPKEIKNLSNFTPKGVLGQLFTQARVLNRLNEALSEHLPEQFRTLSLCAIDKGVATFVTHNQALAFRAQQQNAILLSTLGEIEALTHIEKVIVKVNFKN
ncbi:hypothetical protein [uncultured Gammaproteobacteria bacterium]|uniref:hypothetical protein n=1 Tax=Bathymodiolus heckerae thiotrophic gill symbiont TaxID=1052212 RepID=UPI0010B581E1|nr:hypothetical protein [Bathymodiolus heckerae thiotrophic gill symbiont]CAC9434231.1 hypothetical protein [uncultured Gammaproteobacteria bacterium]SMN13147.1 hypothetical protein BHECKSOX2_130 [Bathymodiolus heckerae thiotrophic gill symbiont]SMN15396.1 hypothetical protein CRYPD_503 [uncultured Candidatus Thioglobus sp.]